MLAKPEPNYSQSTFQRKYIPITLTAHVCMGWDCQQESTTHVFQTRETGVLFLISFLRTKIVIITFSIGYHRLGYPQWYKPPHLTDIVGQGSGICNYIFWWGHYERKCCNFSWIMDYSSIRSNTSSLYWDNVIQRIIDIIAADST